jgi:flagellar motility protein MotE (MotC chaperone)
MSPEATKSPVWVYYAAIITLIAASYAVYLHVRIGDMEAKLNKQAAEFNELNTRYNNIKSALSSEKGDLQSQIDQLEEKLHTADEGFRKELDRSYKEGIDKLNQEREQHTAELEAERARIIGYYQTKYKTSVTPPPPTRTRKK